MLNYQSIKILLQNKYFTGILYVLISTYIFCIWVWSADSLYTSFNGDRGSKLSELIYGSANKPYVNRVFVPFITRTIYNIFPTNTWNSFEKELLLLPFVKKETSCLGWEQDFISEYFITLFILLFSIIAFSFVVRKLWEHFYSTDKYLTNLIPLIVLLILPTLFWTGPHYIYDFPALLLFTTGLLLLLKKKWVFFYFIFILGCLNKETMIFLSPMVFILFKKTDLKYKIIAHLIFQLLIFLVIRIILMNTFADNAGTSLELHLNINIRILLKDYSWASFLIFFITLGLIFYNFGKKPEQLKKCFLLTIPFGFFILIFGIITELRVIYEIIPVIIFLMLDTVLFSIFKIPYKNITEKDNLL